MRVLATGVALAMLAGMTTGCATLRENRPACLAVSIGTGALLGATAGGLISALAVNHGDDEREGSFNWEVGGSTAGGAAAGGLIGWGIAEAICRVEPPPPPPPAPARTPPPPPPVKTERRGG